MNKGIAGNIQRVRSRMQAAAVRCRRNADDITLVAVTKTQPAAAVRAAIQCGITDIGENRVQEAEKKHAAVQEKAVWHFIGNLQRNKVRNVVRFCDVIHSVDSAALAAEIDRRTGTPIDIFVEINIGEEAAKSGVYAGDALDFLAEIRAYPNLRCRGLMTIPPWTHDAEGARRYFREVAEIQREANRIGIFDEPLAGLSMGMTDDFEVAIEEGATVIRVGRALFGERRHITA